MESNPELALIVDFVAECLPFDSLEQAGLLACARAIEIGYFRQGHRFSADDGNGLLIIRSGAVDERNDHGIQQRLESGESFSISQRRDDERDAIDEQRGNYFYAVEDCLIYHLPAGPFAETRAQHRHIDRFFHVRSERRLRRAARYRPQPSYLSQPVSAVMARNVVHIHPQSSITEAAQRMTVHRVSSIVVLDDSGALTGILTDRDLRSRVVAQSMDTALPVAGVMSPTPSVIASHEALFDALLLMTDRNVHHLPVNNAEGRIIGMLSSSDLQIAREDDPLFYVQRLKRAIRVDELRQRMQHLPEMFRQWVDAGTPSSQITRLTTAVSDAVCQTLIRMAVAELGPAPVPFCWLGFGSQARGEQLLGGDQDNGLLISDTVKPGELGWFEALAKRVCDGLNDCGYDYCPGEVMAITPAWRKTLADWRSMVDSWMRSPTPDAVMRVSIFFDLRPIYGDYSLCASLQQHMLQQSQQNTIFLAALADNVLKSTPPLGLFGRLLLEHSGEHAQELNMKKRGVLPIVEAVRLHALANGIVEVNTYKRLNALAASGAMALKDSRNLEDAYSLINDIRLRQQAQQMAANVVPSNYMDPRALSRLQRQHLKQAFRVVRLSHDALRQRYRPGV